MIFQIGFAVFVVFFLVVVVVTLDVALVVGVLVVCFAFVVFCSFSVLLLHHFHSGIAAVVVVFVLVASVGVVGRVVVVHFCFQTLLLLLCSSCWCLLVFVHPLFLILFFS